MLALGQRVKEMACVKEVLGYLARRGQEYPPQAFNWAGSWKKVVRS